MSVRRFVIALGGNAIVPLDTSGTYLDQYQITKTTMNQVAELTGMGHRVVLTHGNGPVVGNIFLRNEAGFATYGIPPMPLFVCGADSQGGLGYMIQQNLQNAMTVLGLDVPVAAVVTQVLVDREDPAFANPTKPIGPYYDREQAERVAQEFGWVVREDAGRGWRRVVPSPRPQRVMEAGVIRAMLEAGVLVVACGGGGVPVVPCGGGRIEGIDAVIDKDLASELLAELVGADTLVIVTQVEKVYSGFGTPAQAALDLADAAELRRLQAAGEFPAGSMGPKIEAALAFLDAGGREVVITDPEHLLAAVRGEAGTRIVAEL
ncbi:MAG TPA: carbamate kinase [Candidatus Krumholzibacteria bacterium]|nr:carbamate kinase [Candidatus Krumholzibacteria bacterium]HRX51102.1 carbamate kinase [Candidatus Krumholzibacteria bacterium]